MPTPAKLSESLLPMVSLSESQLLCILGLGPANSRLLDESVDIVVLVRGRVLQMLVCQGMLSVQRRTSNEWMGVRVEEDTNNVDSLLL